MTTLPTGEQLPEYDDEPRVDPATLYAWLRQQYPGFWGPVAPLTAIGQVLEALQAVGGAQLVKNATYRALVKDRNDLERIGAALARAGRAQEMAVHGVVPTVVTWIDDAVTLAEATAAATARLRDPQ